MKTWKLVSGILSTVLFLVAAFQSCAAGVVDAIAGQGGTSGGGDIALIVLCGLAALTGFAGYGVYKDLVLGAIWCVVCAAFALISLRKNKKKRYREKGGCLGSLLFDHRFPVRKTKFRPQ